MTNKKNTRRALLASLMALLLCFSSLMGTTYAWFTDSVTSSGNKIQAGSLIVDLEQYNKTDKKWESVKASQDPIFNYTNWEPGYTEVTYLKVENEGSLALKWQARLMAEGVDLGISKLGEAIDVYVRPTSTDPTTETITRDLTDFNKVGTLNDFINTYKSTTKGVLKAGQVEYLTIVLKMQESAGNEYQNESIGAFDITILATQVDSEDDSFGNDYDAGLEPVEEGTTIMTVDGIQYLYNDEGEVILYLITDNFVGDTVVVPEGVTRLGNFSFSYNSNVKNVTLSSTVRSLGRAFDTSGVENVVLNEGLEQIDNRAFRRTYSLKSVTIPSTVTTIQESAFQESGISELVIPANVTSLEKAALAYCPNLTSITIEGSPVMANYVARACASLETVLILGDATFTGTSMAFSNAESGKSDKITILVPNNTVKTAVESANGSCTGYTVAVVSKYSEGLYKEPTKNAFYATTAEGVAAFSAWRNSTTVGEGSPLNAWCTLLADVDMAGLDYTAFNGHFTSFDGKGHTIKNLTTKQGVSGKGGFVSYLGGGIIKNLTLENANVTGCQVGLFAGQTEGGKIENCFVKGANTVTWTQNTTSNYVETWNGIGAIVGYSSGGTFNVEICDGATVVLDANGMTSEGTKVDDLTGYGMTNSGTITNNGKVMSVTKVAVSTASELASVLSGAGQAGAGNTYIVLTSDVDLTGITWTPINVDGYHGADIITVEGNGHTISGLSAPLFAGGFAGGSGIVIKDLTIADSTIVSTSTQGSGAFIECVDSMDTITLSNCHLKNSTVSGSRTGGLIGWTAGYNNVNDGPVKLYVTVSDCSVVNCTMNATGSLGGIIGHSGGNAWTYTVVEDCVVENCTLNSTDTGGWRVGVAIGTVNVGEQNDLVNVTSSNNTLTQTGKTAPAGQSDLYGRFVPGTTGKLTIDGNAIN